jgi:hypothetical protein
LSYAKSTWWIYSGATIYVANSLQGFHMRRVKAEVEVIGELSLELNNDFILAYIMFSMYPL